MEEKSLEQAIKEALLADVDLSEEEYKAKNQAADLSTKTHGVKGKAALTEARRHRRIEMNFYGTVLNFLASMLAEISRTNEMLQYLITKGDNGNG